MAITISKVENNQLGEPIEFDLKGLSTDTKPTEMNGFPVGVNSLFLELDTGDFYYLKQQGSSSTTTTTIECDPLTGWNPSRDYSNAYETIIYKDGINLYENLPQNITVTWDGTSYELVGTYDENTHSYLYGELPNDDYEFTWSNYPFCIKSGQSSNRVYCEDNDEHTVSFSWSETVTVEPIWEKVGSKGDTPSGDSLFEGTFTEWEYMQGYGDYYASSASMDYENITGTVSIDWNGTLYENLEDLNESGYGAPWDDNTGSYDFSQYPFNVYTQGNDSTVYVSAPSDDEVTLKIYGTLPPQPEPTLVTAYEGTFTASETGTGAHTGQYYVAPNPSEYNPAYLNGERTCNITFDGNEYELSNESNDVDWYGEYGDTTLTETPFFAVYDRDRATFKIYVADQNQHSMKITTLDYE